MPIESRKKRDHNSFQKVYYSLDNKVKGSNGHTERQRAALIIMQLCQISNTNFFTWLKCPHKIAQNHRYFISVVLNKELHEIFN